jgi:pSer/pThr/pTyr-binding forkhead associated (FHA) protein
MTLTVHILPQRGLPQGVAEALGQLTFDAPRIVIGRSTSCELVLPDPSVSARHASIRHRGSEYVIADEGSTNGILVGAVKLPPHTPRVVRSGEVVRIGRVWLELHIGGGLPGQARQGEAVARRWVLEGLRAAGEALEPSLCVVSGPDEGARFVLSEPEREVIVGRSRDADWALADDTLSRRHVGVVCRGSEIVVRDLGSKRGAELGGRPLGPTALPWRPSERLRIGKTELELSAPLPEALAEALRAPDERMRASEFAEPPPRPSAPANEALEPVAEEPAEDAPPADEARNGAEGVEREEEDQAPAKAGTDRRAADRRYRSLDLLVVLLALGMLGVSATVLLWLLRG